MDNKQQSIADRPGFMDMDERRRKNLQQIRPLVAREIPRALDRRHPHAGRAVARTVGCGCGLYHQGPQGRAAPAPRGSQTSPAPELRAAGGGAAKAWEEF